jgi:acyl carrier protein phosphodiesterase
VNHLAHCALSGLNGDVLAANLIGDDVKGNDWQDYPITLQRGLLLHRRIDSFTDSHPLVSECIREFRPYAKRFAGPVCDILFDHLLATDWARYYDGYSLDQFATQAYEQLTARAHLLPEAWQRRLPHMIEGDFLRGYLTREGLEFVFSRFIHRLPPNTLDIEGLLDHFYVEMPRFRERFAVFYPELQEVAHNYLENRPQ